MGLIHPIGHAPKDAYIGFIQSIGAIQNAFARKIFFKVMNNISINNILK